MEAFSASVCSPGRTVLLCQTQSPNLTSEPVTTTSRGLADTPCGYQGTMILPPIMDNQMEGTKENEMETRITQGFIRIKVSQNQACLFKGPHTKEYYSIWGSILRSPVYRQYQVATSS